MGNLKWGGMWEANNPKGLERGGVGARKHATKSYNLGKEYNLLEKLEKIGKFSLKREIPITVLLYPKISFDKLCLVGVWWWKIYFRYTILYAVPIRYHLSFTINHKFSIPGTVYSVFCVCA